MALLLMGEVRAMLRLILGRAGTGKTARIMEEIRDLSPAGGAGTVPCVLIVPEQYSHEAERELCRVCGDRLSLYAEVLSFTRLAHTVAVELGGSARRYMDQGGRLLCMALALDGAGAGLQLFGSARRQPALQKSLLTPPPRAAAPTPAAAWTSWPRTSPTAPVCEARKYLWTALSTSQRRSGRCSGH
jgi:ATP-dependent helicase/nuclease subunit B